MAAKRPMASNKEQPRERARPRAPSRGRGVARYEALLDATEGLLAHQSPDDVGLYQIAEAAGVPPASVYHFFPTKDAAFAALVQRYVNDFARLSHRPFPASSIHRWSDYMAIEQERVREYYGAHPAALKLICGGYGGIESRKIDSEFVSLLADRMYGRYDTLFHMPYIAEPAMQFLVSLTIMDSIWSLSYLKHGRITREYAAEALAACVAYCRLFLPDRLEIREEVRQLAASGGELAMPIEFSDRDIVRGLLQSNSSGDKS